MNRFQQIVHVHSFSAQTDELKQTWIIKIKKSAEKWKRNYSSNSSKEQQQQQQQHQIRQPTSVNQVPNDCNQASRSQQSFCPSPNTKNVTIKQDPIEEYQQSQDASKRTSLEKNAQANDGGAQSIRLIVTSASESPQDSARNKTR